MARLAKVTGRRDCKTLASSSTSWASALSCLGRISVITVFLCTRIDCRPTLMATSWLKSDLKRSHVYRTSKHRFFFAQANACRCLRHTLSVSLSHAHGGRRLRPCSSRNCQRFASSLSSSTMLRPIHMVCLFASLLVRASAIMLLMDVQRHLAQKIYTLRRDDAKLFGRALFNDHPSVIQSSDRMRSYLGADDTHRGRCALSFPWVDMVNRCLRKSCSWS